MYPLLRHEIDENRGNAGNLHRKGIVAAGAITRKRLSDITNTGRRLERVGEDDDKENRKIAPCVCAKDYVELMKENTALMKHLAERNKIIEVSNIELRKLRFALQKSKQQNCHLAQANTQMLMELNLGKDRVFCIYTFFGFHFSSSTRCFRTASLPMAITHQEEAPEEKKDRRKSLRRRSCSLNSESCESMDDSLKTEDFIIPDCSIKKVHEPTG